MDFLTLAKERYSVLDYEMRDIEQEKIDQILEAGRLAPTACNIQPQRVLVIRDDEGRRKLEHSAPSGRYVPAAFLVCYDKAACWKRPMDGKSSGDIDAAIVTTHMMLGARALGLGSIWVMYWDPEKIKREFDLEDGLEPVALLIVGYASAEAAPRKGHWVRKPIQELLIKQD